MLYIIWLLNNVFQLRHFLINFKIKRMFEKIINYYLKIILFDIYFLIKNNVYFLMKNLFLKLLSKYMLNNK